jgi:4-hydroxy-tetrahydrodipicolinate synthase
MTNSRSLGGVLPVLATPFAPDGQPDANGLRRIARYVVGAGADGVVYPGVASEYDMLTPAERVELTAVVADEARGRVALVVGGSAPTT